MSMNKGTYTRLMKLLNEVGSLAAAATMELDNETHWDHDARAVVKTHPNGIAPNHAHQMMGTKATAALRRRSMDLTRLLAEMRRAN